MSAFNCILLLQDEIVQTENSRNDIYIYFAELENV